MKWKPLYTYVLIALALLAAGLFWYFRKKNGADKVSIDIGGEVAPTGSLNPDDYNTDAVMIRQVNTADGVNGTYSAFHATDPPRPWQEHVNEYFNSRYTGFEPAAIVQERIDTIKASPERLAKIIDKAKLLFGSMPGAGESVLVWDSIAEVNLSKEICKNTNIPYPTIYSDAASPNRMVYEDEYLICAGVIPEGEPTITDNEVIVFEDETELETEPDRG